MGTIRTRLLETLWRGIDNAHIGIDMNKSYEIANQLTKDLIAEFLLEDDQHRFGSLRVVQPDDWK